MICATSERKVSCFESPGPSSHQKGYGSSPSWLFVSRHHRCFFLRIRQQYAQIPQIISRGSCQDRVTQLREKRKSIASLKEISRIEACLLRAVERLSVGHRAGPGAIAVNPVRPRAQHCHFLSRDFFHTSEHECRIPSPHPVSPHR